VSEAIFELLEEQRELERRLAAEGDAAIAPDMLHFAAWRRRLARALRLAAEGRPAEPIASADEINAREMPGFVGRPLDQAWAESDAAFDGLLGAARAVDDLERPVEWFGATSAAEALVRNSYNHPRVHLHERWRSTHPERGHRLIEEADARLRAVAAPSRARGAAAYNLAVVRVAQGRIDEARALLEEAKRLRPEAAAAAESDPDLEPLRR
jgi:tetratricopeptide (TPR) repeat protein